MEPKGFSFFFCASASLRDYIIPVWPLLVSSSCPSCLRVIYLPSRVRPFPPPREFTRPLASV
jgi:hypothetical protein